MKLQPARPEDRRRERERERAVEWAAALPVGYRSEAFAEDLCGDEAGKDEPARAFEASTFRVSVAPAVLGLVAAVLLGYAGD
jgi:hypothetical protein